MSSFSSFLFRPSSIDDVILYELSFSSFLFRLNEFSWASRYNGLSVLSYFDVFVESPCEDGVSFSSFLFRHLFDTFFYDFVRLSVLSYFDMYSMEIQVMYTTFSSFLFRHVEILKAEILTDFQFFLIST